MERVMTAVAVNYYRNFVGHRRVFGFLRMFLFHFRGRWSGDNAPPFRSLHVDTRLYFCGP